MNDINWRSIDSDKSIFLPENAHKKILVKTKSFSRIYVEWAEDVRPGTNVLKTANEVVEQYAFID